LIYEWLREVQSTISGTKIGLHIARMIIYTWSIWCPCASASIKFWSQIKPLIDHSNYVIHVQMTSFDRQIRDLIADLNLIEVGVHDPIMQPSSCWQPEWSSLYRNGMDIALTFLSINPVVVKRIITTREFIKFITPTRVQSDDRSPIIVFRIDEPFFSIKCKSLPSVAGQTGRPRCMYVGAADWRSTLKRRPFSAATKSINRHRLSANKLHYNRLGGVSSAGPGLWASGPGPGERSRVARDPRPAGWPTDRRVREGEDKRAVQFTRDCMSILLSFTGGLSDKTNVTAVENRWSVWT